MRAVLPIVLGVMAFVPAVAGPNTMNASQLAQSAKAHLNEPIGLSGAYCYAATHGYECRTVEALRIATDAMPAGAAKSAMDNDCGEIDGIEQSAGCRFTLQMVPTDVATRDDDYVRKGRQVKGKITVVTVTVISAQKE